MADKRYFWLKLKENYFDSPKIKKLRKIAGGDTYTIIYLKLQLLSIKNNGYIEYEKIEPTFQEELALKLDEDVENISVTISYLQSQGLIDMNENNDFFLLEASNNIGSESESAERVRQFRERKNQKALQSNDCVTQVKQISISNSNSNSISNSNSNILKEKENKKEKENTIDDIISKQDEKIQSPLKEYVKMRKAIKKPITEHGLELAIAKLNRLSKNINEQIEIINLSVMNSWQGLFPLKENEQVEPTEETKEQKIQRELLELRKARPDLANYTDKELLRYF
jgi:predicted phage replisome organizer